MGLFSFKKAAPEVNTEKKKKRRTKDTNQSQSFVVTDEVLIAYAQSDPIISAGVQVTVDNVAQGYSFKPQDDSDEAMSQMEQAEKLFYNDNFQDKIENITKSLVILADAFQEKRIWIDRGLVQMKTDIIDTASIKIKTNKDTGEVTGYAQVIDGTEKVQLSKNEVVHYRVNSFGSSHKGNSLIEAVLYSSALKKFIEKYNGSIFMNHKPRGVWMFPEEMGDDEFNENVKEIVDNKQKPHKDIFLKGSGVDFKSFDASKDMGFKEALQEARLEIVVGMLVPPIMIGIPEGSNRASADVELQSFDRRVASLQKSIQYKVDNELLKPLGFDKINFVLDKSSKRDEVRELERVNLMKGLITLNEARAELGLSELDEEEYPEANKLWADFAPVVSSEDSLPDEKAQDEQKDLEKSLDLKKKVESTKTIIEIPEVSLKEEEQVLAKFKDWNIKTKQKIREEVKKYSSLNKQINDPKGIVDAVKGAIDWQSLATLYSANIIKKYIESGEYAMNKFDRNFIPRKDELEFLESYNFDLIKNMEEKNVNTLTDILRRNILEGKSIDASTQELMTAMDRTRVDAERIVRTELNRANSQGSLAGMQSMPEDFGIKKYLIMVSDNRTSDISKALNRKYGTPEQAIPLDATFKVVVKGKKVEGKSTPFHINDRDTMAYVMSE